MHKLVKDCSDCAEYDETTKKHNFPEVRLSTDDMAPEKLGQTLADKIFVLTVQETTFKKTKHGTQQVETFICQARLSVIGMLKYATKSTYTVILSDKKGKPKARMFMRDFGIKSLCSFTDLYMKHSLNIVPVIAVDFSLANLTFDDMAQCTGTLHSLKETTPNDYTDALSTVSRIFRHFSRFSMPVGFGARTLKQKEGNACNLFSLTGEIVEPFMSTDAKDLRKGYGWALKNAQLALPVLYQQVLKFVCDLGATEMVSDIHDVKNYYVLVLMMAGVIDDFKDALNELLRAANLPVSIYIIKMGKCSEDNDSEKFI